MKFLFYKFSKGKSTRRKRVHVNFERKLFLAFIITFILLVIVQAGLTNPSIRTFLTSNEEYEGTPLGAEEVLYSEGELVLELVGQDVNDKLKVLVNGDEAAVFSEKKITLKVKNGDVIEIDGSEEGKNAEVAVVSQSTNISTDFIGKKIQVNSNIRKLAKIKI